MSACREGTAISGVPIKIVFIVYSETSVTILPLPATGKLIFTAIKMPILLTIKKLC